jgi:hypothetical protein
LREKIRGQCPCGYVFNIFGEIAEGISLIKKHCDLVHKDFLPFGITTAEALSLLKREDRYFLGTQNKVKKNKEDNSQRQKRKPKIIQWIEV